MSEDNTTPNNHENLTSEQVTELCIFLQSTKGVLISWLII